ncbi:MAG: hypothetical protein N4A45_11505 [Flavobacteriales bacterium]|jgi:hypothetical protein|nr:hypothetical protein [Flavobacteriales bacterium]
MKLSTKTVSLALVFYLSGLLMAIGQVGIGTITPDVSSKLDITATDKGLLIPRVSLTGSNDVTTIANPSTSLLVFNTATVGDISPGFYFYDGSKWQPFATGAGGASKWTNDNANSLVKLTNLSDGSTSRPVNNGIYIHDNGYFGINNIPESMFHLESNSHPLTNGKPLAQIINSSSSTARAGGLLVQGGNNNQNSYEFQTLDKHGNIDFIIDGLGNVGIGNETPLASLDIVGGLNAGRSLRVKHNSVSKSNGVYTFEIDNSNHTSNLSESGAFKVDVNSGRAFTINGNGNVGVGTSTPTFGKMQIEGNAAGVFYSNLSLSKVDGSKTSFLNFAIGRSYASGFPGVDTFAYSTIHVAGSGGAANVGVLGFAYNLVEVYRFSESSAVFNGKLGLGGVEPMETLHIDAHGDSLQIDNLAGSGNLLGIDDNGKVTKTTATSVLKVISTSGSHSCAPTDEVVILNIDPVTNGGITTGTVNLNPNPKTGQFITIKKRDATANPLTINLTNGYTLEDDVTTVITMSVAYQYIKLVFDGDDWVVIGKG